MNTVYLPGRGDQATWPAYDGHANDPRAPLEDDEVQDTLDALDEAVDNIRAAARTIRTTGNAYDKSAHTALDVAVILLGGTL